MDDSIYSTPAFDINYFKPKKVRRRVLPQEKTHGRAVLDRVMAYRGVEQFDKADYAIDKLIPPVEMKGLNDACRILHEAFVAQQNGQRQKLLVVGDFDVDGATSVVVALKGLRSMGFDIDYFIPDRFKLGYGLSPAVVEAAAPFQPTHLITVDNGIASVDGVAAAKAMGWKVIITDHHLAGDHIPDADAIVNPNQPGCNFPSKNLAGVGVIFYVLIGLRSYFRQQGVPPQFQPHLGQLLDLLALGTVADVVALDENNRRLVHLGLTRMRAGHACLGIKALAEVAGRDITQVSEGDLGFAFGPRLNAAGRLDDMSVGVQCLLSNDWHEALRHAKVLDDLNRQRRDIQDQMQVEADHLLSDDLSQMSDEEMPKAMLMYQPDWHQGIVGLLASRLKERWHRPVIALAKVSETELKGSGRSIPGVHLRDALDVVSKRAPEVLSKFGGHSMAAGLSLNLDQLEKFEQVFHEVMDEIIAPEMLAQELLSDGGLLPQEMNVDLAMAIEDAGPWGQAFPEPVFDGEFRVLSAQWLKEKHLKLTLEPAEEPLNQGLGQKNGPTYVEALYFNVPLNAYAADDLDARALFESIERVHCVYKLNVNRFRGQIRLQLMIDYLQPLEA